MSTKQKTKVWYYPVYYPYGGVLICEEHLKGSPLEEFHVRRESMYACTYCEEKN